MLWVAKIIGLFWVAMILTYGSITIAIVSIQGAARLVKRAISRMKEAAN